MSIFIGSQTLYWKLQKEYDKVPAVEQFKILLGK
jgi:hypothetical protein